MARGAFNLGKSKRGGPKMYMGGSKNFDESTGTYRNGYQPAKRAYNTALRRSTMSNMRNQAAYSSAMKNAAGGPKAYGRGMASNPYRQKAAARSAMNKSFSQVYRATKRAAAKRAR